MSAKLPGLSLFNDFMIFLCFFFVRFVELNSLEHEKGLDFFSMDRGLFLSFLIENIGPKLAQGKKQNLFLKNLLLYSKNQRRTIQYCLHNSVIKKWWVNAVHLMKLNAFADGFHVNIYVTLQSEI